jgi:hypothetical protein
MSLGWLLAILLLIWFTWRMLHQRDLALAYVRRWCVREHLQLLDDSVSFSGWRRWPGSVASVNARSAMQHALARLRPVQQFRFEISNDGRERRQGRLLMHGQSMLRLQIETADGNQLIEEFTTEGKVS